ncbi:MAG: hypothetical protein ACJAZ2_001249 [Glaciecola sp.]|jgi:hypothetical protein
MEKLNKDLLEQWLNDIQRIIFDINITVDNLNRLIVPESNFEKQILEHGFFGQFYKQSWFTSIVQLSKLYTDSKNQKRNLFKFFNILENFKYDTLLLDELENNKNSPGQNLYFSKDDVLDSTQKLREKIADKKTIIEYVIFLRDKTHAHSDVDPGLPSVSVTDLTELRDLSIIIHNTISAGFLDTSFPFSIDSDWRVDYPIKMLAKQREELEEKS